MRKISYLIFVLAAITFSAGIAQAQLDPVGDPKYKVGDRVEFDSLMAGDPSRAQWVKATVVRIDVQKLGGGSLTQTSYVIKLDSGREMSVTRKHAEGDPYWHSAGWFRPTADAGPPPNNDQPNNPPPAQPNGPPNNGAVGGKYKKGDCVDFDVLQTGDPNKAQWKPAKIVDVQNINLGGGLTQLTYIVQLDQPGPTGLPQRSPVSQRMAEGGMTYAGDPNRRIGFLRPRGCNGAAPNIESAKLHTDANGNVTADRPLVDCDNLKRGPARNGQQPNADLMKKIIQCLWETPGTPNLHAPRKIDITQFAAGGTRRWNVNNDLGPGGAIDTVIWQFRVTYDSTIFNRDINELELGHQGLFKCWVAVDKWQCGEDDVLKWGQKKDIEVTK